MKEMETSKKKSKDVQGGSYIGNIREKERAMDRRGGNNFF